MRNAVARIQGDLGHGRGSERVAALGEDLRQIGCRIASRKVSYNQPSSAATMGCVGVEVSVELEVAVADGIGGGARADLTVEGGGGRGRGAKPDPIEPTELSRYASGRRDRRAAYHAAAKGKESHFGERRRRRRSGLERDR